MKSMKKEMLIPSSLKNFQCIGGACEDSCCSGWKVAIDQGTYQKYKTVQEPDIQAKLAQSIEINDGEQNFYQYASMDITKGCSFLTSKGSCQIHESLGEAYLSGTCSKYPRIVHLVDQTFEKTATLSCPEVARQFLLPHEKVSFEFREETIDERDMVSFQLQTKEKPYTEHFLLLRELSIAILQKEEEPLEEKLKFLGLFIHDISTCVEEQRTENILPVITQYKEKMNMPFELKEMASPGSQEKLVLLEKVLERKKEEVAYSNRYKECLEEMRSGYELTASLFQTKDNQYSHLQKQYEEKVLADYEHVMENFLVHFAFRKLFPFSYGETIFESYAMLVLQYTILKQHLMGMIEARRGVEENDFIRLVQSWSKETEHNVFYLKGYYEFLKKNGWMNKETIFNLFS